MFGSALDAQMALSEGRALALADLTLLKDQALVALSLNFLRVCHVKERWDYWARLERLCVYNVCHFDLVLSDALYVELRSISHGDVWPHRPKRLYNTVLASRAHCYLAGLHKRTRF